MLYNRKIAQPFSCTIKACKMWNARKTGTANLWGDGIMTEALYPQLPRLHVNRGGEIDEREVIGRERELDNLLRTLDKQSVLVAAERRIGKTTLCKQAQRQLSNDTLALYQDIE